MDSNQSTLRVIHPHDTPSEEPIDPIGEAAASAGGLDGFKSEIHEVSAAESQPSSRRMPWLTVGLVALVVVESIPTALWAREYFSGASALALAPPPVAAPATPPASLEAVAPCEPPVVNPAPADAPQRAAASASGAANAVAPRFDSHGIAAGVLSVVAPVSLNVYSRGRLIGTSEAESIMLPLGAYDLELVNEAVGYRTRKSVTVQAGRKTTLQIDPPAGTLHVNAVPWAEVWIDDHHLGETPIGNVKVPVGMHEIIFRHPEFGERRTRVLVTLKEAGRVSIDLRKK